MPTLADEIRNDHKRILNRLQQLINRRRIEPEFVRPTIAAIGAHHLAEEDTLYDALKSFALASIGEAQVYHLVLDDLTHDIDVGGCSGETLQYQLSLLLHLLENHFQFEETQLLETLSSKFSIGQQVELGRQYRQRYRQSITALHLSSKAGQLTVVELKNY